MERGNIMKKNIIAALIFVLMICTSFTCAFAAELFADFTGETKSLDTSVWTEDLSEFNAASVIDENGRYSVSGNINAGKAISLEAQISANEDIVRIEYDVNPNIKRNKGELHSYLKIGSNEYRLVRFRRVTVDDVAISGYNIHFALRDNAPVYVDSTGEKAGKWYRIAVEINKITENVTISITDYSAETVLATQDIPFPEFFGTEDAAAEYKSSGFDALKYIAKADSKDTALNLTYRMVKVTSVPYVKEVTLKDALLDTELAEKLAYVGNEVKADVVLNDDTAQKTIEWYREGENDAIGSDTTYTLTSADVGKKIYVKVTPMDSDTIGNTVNSDSIDTALFKAHQNTDITKETIEFFTLIDTNTLTPENVTLTPGNIKPVSITTDDEKVFTLNFEEGALTEGESYTITLNENVYFKNTDSAAGSGAFKTVAPPAVKLERVSLCDLSGKSVDYTQKGIYVCKVKIYVKDASYEEVYENSLIRAGVYRNGVLVNENAFVMDIKNTSEAESEAAVCFMLNPETDILKWSVEQEKNGIFNKISAGLQIKKEGAE